MRALSVGLARMAGVVVSAGSVLKEKRQSHVLLPFAVVCVQAEVSIGVMNAIRRSHHERVERRRLQLISFARYCIFISHHAHPFVVRSPYCIHDPN